MLKKVLAALVVCTLWITPVLADVIKPVQDNLHVLTKAEDKKLTNWLMAHKTKILVITKKSDNIEEDALKLGRETGVDIVLWFNGNKIRTEVGTKLEGSLPDGLTSEIVQNNVKLLQDKSYYTFFHNVTGEFYQKLSDTTTNEDAFADLIIAYPWLLLVVWFVIFCISPEFAIWMLFFWMMPKGGYNSGSGDFSGGGSTDD